MSRPPKTSKVTRRRPNRFREREVARVMRAARTSGVPVREITIDPATGKIGVIVGEAADTTEDLQKLI
jgi:hypothetical protein